MSFQLLIYSMNQAGLPFCMIEIFAKLFQNVGCCLEVVSIWKRDFKNVRIGNIA